MTVIREWAVGLCTAAIGCSLLHLLCPEGTVKKGFGMLTAVFFFCCLLSPLQAVGSVVGELFTLPQTHAEVPQTLSETADEQVASVLESALLQDAQALLEEYGITVRRVEVVRDTTRTDSIYIERVKVVFDKDDHPVSAAVCKRLEQAWETAVEVYYVD